MTKRMLIDATDAEETRVVVLDGTRLEEFDVETSTKKQLKGNIYLAKVVRVEPSLQAAFIEYGGNRHGFLAFGEIHPDYYQIPVADRQRLIAAQAEEARLEEEEEDRAAAAEAAGKPYTPPPQSRRDDDNGQDEPEQEFQAEAAARDYGTAAPDDEDSSHDDQDSPPDEAGSYDQHDAPPPEAEAAAADPEAAEQPATTAAQPARIQHDLLHGAPETDAVVDAEEARPHAQADHDAGSDPTAEPADDAPLPLTGADGAPSAAELAAAPAAEDAVAEAIEPDTAAEHGETAAAPAADLPPPETVGGDTAEDTRERRIPPKFLRNYKIQEVIKRRQILLVQVVKEERGTKGAALTTYLSLAGRFCVLMPNSPRGGGISRKITSAADRKRLKEITAELDIPAGMGLIVRTAGANRPKPEIKRDCEYLLRLWDDIREHTMQSVAPALIYEEANLIKRAIRDVYSRDVDEIMVDGEEAFRAARNFMNMLMPSHVRKVVLHSDPTAGGGLPLFAKHQVDAQLDAMLSPTVQLKSGGYLVINQAEALVAIDVNSGRSTRERNIEETALRTNLEAADEVARQLRLRDLAGLIVIDFIDMEAKKHNAMVERRMKEALKNDRARIQVGHISHFGLLEMSRQRLRPSLAETNFVTCLHCAGLGLVRSTESAAIHALRGIEEEAAKQRAAEIMVHVAAPVLMYLVNHKRERIAAIEARYGMRVLFGADATLSGTQMRIDRLRAQVPREVGRDDAGPVAMIAPAPLPLLEAPAEAPDVVDEEDEPIAATPAAGAPVETEQGADGDRPRRRRRRRRRGGRREDGSPAEPGSEDDAGDDAEPEPLAAADAPAGDAPAPLAAEAASEAGGETLPAETAEESAQRRRSRRGGRRRRRDAPEAEGTLPEVALPGSEQPELPAYVGPTPADPFGGQTFDIFDVMEQAEARAAEAAAAPPRRATPPAAEAPLPAPVAPPPEPAAAEAAPTLHVEEAPQAANGHEPEPEPPAAPAIKPIVVGTVPVEDPKRGWWRR
jgi:ribonuclease E